MNTCDARPSAQIEWDCLSSFVKAEEEQGTRSSGEKGATTLEEAFVSMLLCRPAVLRGEQEWLSKASS
jgi:hypothetical protein